MASLEIPACMAPAGYGSGQSGVPTGLVMGVA